MLHPPRSRGVAFALACAFTLTLTVPVNAQEEAPAAPAERDLSRFDELDPEIRKAADVDFHNVDLAKTDERTQLLAAIALNDLLTVARNKAEHRVGLGMQYIDDNKLTEAFGGFPKPESAPEPLSYEDGQRLAVAYVSTDEGSSHFAGRITTDDADMQQRMLKAYNAMNRQMWTETIEQRQIADRIARFLDSQGKFDAFMGWAAGEAKKQADAHALEMEQRQVEYAARMERERAERMKVAEANAQRRHEEKMKRLELTYEYKTEKVRAQSEAIQSYNNRMNSYSGWAWDDDYYRHNYRGRYGGIRR